IEPGRSFRAWARNRSARESQSGSALGADASTRAAVPASPSPPLRAASSSRAAASSGRPRPARNRPSTEAPRAPSAPTCRAARPAELQEQADHRLADGQGVRLPGVRGEGPLEGRRGALALAPGREDPGAELGHGEAVAVDRDESFELSLGLVEGLLAEEDAGVE